MVENIISQSVPESQHAMTFLNFIVEKYIKFDKSEIKHYLLLLEKTTYVGVSGVYEHSMELVHYHNKLQSMKVDLRDNFLI